MSNIAIANNPLDRMPKIILHFWGTNNLSFSTRKNYKNKTMIHRILQSLLLFLMDLSQVIALLTIAIAIVVARSRSKEAIA